MRHQLLFEPRRTAVWAARATAVGLAAVVGVPNQLFCWAGIYLVAAQRGIDPPPALCDGVAWMLDRGTFGPPPLGGDQERYIAHANFGAVIQGRYTYWIETPDDCYDPRTGEERRQDGGHDARSTLAAAGSR